MEIMGFTFGLMGFLFALSALSRIDKLEKKLKESGVPDSSITSE